MKKQTRNTLVNKVLPISLILILSITAFSFIFSSLSDNEQLKETNWEGLVKLGLAPSMDSRPIIEQDRDTGLRINYNNQVLALVQSGDFKTYGKTFLVRIK